ncbi:TPA: hypothetical protein ACQFKX_000740 [Proteus mirabilis]|uniref:hypothetical protein n=1 Tax=Proteus mirabilis TaxID=584 RepID=UPI000664E7D5|nr:hypothetical protein [Proteus mirabilis]MBI6272535.1 hypothetical protein [Proteus mirabilis]
MELLPYPESHPIQVKLDWLELMCLRNEYFTFRVSELRNILENLESFESSDIGVEDAAIENEIQRILEQLQIRISIMSDCYPFIYNEEDCSIDLVQDSIERLHISQHIYLYCLYFSHISKSRLLNNIPEITNTDRDLLQITASVALAGLTNGQSISFGFPRPDSSGFYQALQRAINLLGEGILKPFQQVNRYLQTIPVKDAGIDVISWGSHNDTDELPGIKQIIFAQVASGNNWRTKPVKNDIEAIQQYWLDQRIYRVTDAIVIPFDIENDDMTVHKDQLRVLSNEFGCFLFRLRLPSLFRKGLELSISKPELLIERVNSVSHISDFVIEKTNLLREEAA